MQTTQLPTTQLGQTGLEITRVGFGAWAIGGGGCEWGWGPQDDDESIAAIHRALELGVNWIDTAAAYGFGHSEEVVGPRARGPRRAPVRVHEGRAARRARGGPRCRACKRDSLLREVEGSLKRLGVDAIDLYQIHWPIPDERDRGGLVDARRAEGTGPGPPHRRVQLRRRAAAADPADRPGRDPAAAVLAGRPRRRGGDPALRRARGDRRDRLLADGLRPADRRDDPRADRAPARRRLAQARASASRSRSSRSTSRWWSGCRRSPSAIDTTPGAVAVAWTLRNPAVDGAIVGFRRPDQVDPILRRGTWTSPTRTSRRSKGGHEMTANTSMKPTIGFVGLGTMGGNMAARFLAAGYTVHGEDRSREQRRRR